MLCVSAENILAAGAPSESDWWEDASDSSVEFDVDTQEEVVSRDSTLDSKASSPRRARFRNVGLETWEQVQQAWRSSNSPPQNTMAPSPSSATRRELLKGLASNRQYEMKQRVALQDMIAIYNEMWAQELSD